MRHIISVLLENESGALSRVVGLFSQRGYNIETLTVAPTEDPTLSRMTIVTMGDERVLEQIQKQLHKLVDVLKVCDLSEGEHIEREIALVKARAAGGARDELKRLADIFRGQIVDVTPSSTRYSWWAPARSWMLSSRPQPRPTRSSKWCAPASAASRGRTRRCGPDGWRDS